MIVDQELGFIALSIALISVIFLKQFEDFSLVVVIKPGPHCPIGKYFDDGKCLSRISCSELKSKGSY